MSCSGGPSQRGRGARRDSGGSSPVLSRSVSVTRNFKVSSEHFIFRVQCVILMISWSLTTPWSGTTSRQWPHPTAPGATRRPPGWGSPRRLSPSHRQQSLCLFLNWKELWERRAVAQAQAPLLEKINAVSKKVNHTSNQMTKVENIVENMNKKNKDILEAVDKVWEFIQICGHL